MRERETITNRGGEGGSHETAEGGVDAPMPHFVHVCALQVMLSQDDEITKVVLKAPEASYEKVCLTRLPSSASCALHLQSNGSRQRQFLVASKAWERSLSQIKGSLLWGKFRG